MIRRNLLSFQSTQTQLLLNSIFIERNLKLNKYLNFTVEDEIIYISDNIGFIYAYNYLSYGQKIIKFHSDQI